MEMDDNDKGTLHKLLTEINFIKKFYKNEDNIILYQICFLNYKNSRGFHKFYL